VTVLLGLTAALVATWLYLALGRGFFWRTSIRLEPSSSPAVLSRWPSVTVVVPARNEAAVLARTLASLLAQDYPGEGRVVVVDDRSQDDTTAVAWQAASGTTRSDAGESLKLEVVRGAALPAGWSGKVWALDQGVRAAGDPDYLLLTDADIEHPPDSLRRLVAKAERDRLDMVSLMAKLRAGNLWERLLVPAFVYFFAQLYPFSWVNRAGSRTAAAAGGCVLVRSEALRRAGAFESIREAVIDDVSLARALKGSSSSLWLGFADSVSSIRPYDRLADLWHMVARSAFDQLRYSSALLAGTVVGLLFVFVLPVAALVTGAVSGDLPVALLGALSWAVMALTYVPMLRYYGIWPGAALLLPFTATLYATMTVDSARRHWSGNGVAWRGHS
jgi:hopene-associated glycosyltransferase HpnB